MSEAALADLEKHGRHVRQLRLAQLPDDHFKSWSREHDAACKNLRYGLSQPATRVL